MYEPKKPRVSIIMANWFTDNQHGSYCEHETYFFAQECLKRIIKYTDLNNAELILIDNGSTLKDGDIPSEWMPVSEFWSHADVLIRNKENLGFGPAVSQGVYLANGEYILQTNNDMLVFPNWLDDMLAVFDRTDLVVPVGVVMPNLIKKNFQSDCINERGKLDIFKVMELTKDKIQYPRKNDIEIRSEFGSLWIMKNSLAKELIKKDGFFFDPQFLLGMSEDRDLWIRVRELGYETYRVNSVRLAHIGNCTIGKIKNRKEYTEVNREKLKKKWNK